MYAANNRKGEYERKRATLLAKAQRNASLRSKRDEAVANAIWSDEVAKNAINLNLSKSTSSSQTDTINLDSYKEARERTNTGDLYKEARERSMKTLEDYDIGDEDDSLSDLDDRDVEDAVKQFQDLRNRRQLQTSFDKLGLHAFESKHGREDATDMVETGDEIPLTIKEIRESLLTLLANNKERLKRVKLLAYNNINEPINPKAYYVDRNTLEIKNTNGQHVSKREVQEAVNWKNTLVEFLQETHANHIPDLDTRGTAITYNGPSKRSLEDSFVSVSEGVRIPSHKVAKNENSAYERKIVKAFELNPWLVDDRIHPAVRDPTYGIMLDQKYIFSTAGQLINRETNAPIAKKDLKSLKARIQWGRTFYMVLQHIEKVDRVVSSRDDDKYTSIKSNIDKTRKELESMDTDPFERLRSTPARIESNVTKQISGEGIIKSGRGLRGAGAVRKPNRPFNLREIEGSGLASAQKYKALGSKFIRLADLDQGKLKLVYANRTSVGRIRPISSEVVDILKEAVYDGNINQNKYARLEHDDKALVHEIIKACHLEYQAKQPLKEPREHLKAEFDKLRGIIMMGNDSPVIVKELKALSIDMFQNGLITKLDFKNISML